MLADPRFAVPSHRKAMILVTDGLVNPGGPNDVLQAANRARADGIAVYAIGYGTAIADALLLSTANARLGSYRYYYRSPIGMDLEPVITSLKRTVPCPADIYWPNTLLPPATIEAP